jgi:ABC-type phosphate transport system permease subunit
MARDGSEAHTHRGNKSKRYYNLHGSDINLIFFPSLCSHTLLLFFAIFSLDESRDGSDGVGGGGQNMSACNTLLVVFLLVVCGTAVGVVSGMFINVCLHARMVFVCV